MKPGAVHSSAISHDANEPRLHSEIMYGRSQHVRHEGKCGYRDVGFFGIQPPSYSAAKQEIACATKLLRPQVDCLEEAFIEKSNTRACLLYTSPSPRDGLLSRMPSSA